MRVFCLGSGSSGNGYVIQSNNSSLLIECGFEFAKLVKKLHSYNIALTDINTVLVTHSHIDHARAVAELEDLGVDIITPYKNTDKISSYNTHFEIGFFPVCHDVVAYGFTITLKDTNEKILFINDTSCCDLPKEVLNEQFDYIFIECNHTRRKLKELMESASEEKLYKYERQIKFHLSLAGTKKMLSMLDLSRVKTIYLMHLSEEASEPKVMKEVVTATFNKKVEVFLKEGGLLE